MRLRIVGAALLVAACSVATIGPVGATTSGSERFQGAIVSSGASGSRVVLSSAIVASGAFRGVGRIVEIENLPSDSDDVSRDDLVFAAGTMHLVSTTLDVAFSLNPRSCTFTGTLQQTGAITGGTGKFAAAIGTLTQVVTARGLLARNADGTCSQEQLPVAEVDTVAMNGSLSF